MSIAIANLSKAYGINQTELKYSRPRASRAEEKRDMVEFSAKSQDYSFAAKMLANVPDVRNETVESVKARMAAGKYDIPSGTIANKILTDYNNRQISL